MASHGVYGRQGELHRLDELTGRLAHGEGGALVVRGEAGIGKSTLLAAAADMAVRRGGRVLTATGVQSETTMPFAGLHQLLAPVLDLARHLPARQGGALLAAFGLSEDAAPEPFLIGLASLELISDAVASEPALLVVEDAQWIDPASCDVLGFIARRLRTEPAVMVVALRDGCESPLDDADLPELRLSGLDDVAAGALLDAVSPGLRAPVRHRLLQEADGNPLALVELPAALEAEHLGDRAVLPARLPSTDRLERTFTSQVKGLPPVTRSVLLLAAANDTDSVAEVLDAAEAMTGERPGADALFPAVAARLVEINGTELGFRHPLVRSAIYHGAPLDERLAAHGALATVLEDQPDRQVWHRAAASLEPDEDVAAALEATAERAMRRGAPATAAAALERAAALSHPTARRGHLLVRAAEVELELGRTDVALRHLAEAKPLPLADEERTRSTLWLEAFNEEGWSDSARVGAFAEIAGHLTSVEETTLALKALLTVAVGCWWGKPTQATRDLVIADAERLKAAPDDPALLGVLACADPVQRGAVVVEQISTIAPTTGTDPAALHHLGTAASAVWTFDRSWSFLCGAVDGLREEGRLGLLAQALVSQAWAAVHLSKGAAALSAADEAGRLARETGQRRWGVAADLAMATVIGERGDLESADRLAREAEAALLPMGSQSMLSLVQFARGRCAVAHQSYVEGLEHLQRVVDPSDVAFHPFVAYWVLPDLIEAAARTDRPEQARRHLADLEAMAERTTASYLRATLAYVRPMLAPDDEAEALYRRALDPELSNWPCFRARLLLDYGRWLRRQRRVIESRAPLRAARESFDALAFDGLAALARQELRATGETSLDRRPDARDHLTPQELQIAQMAADGLTNREIGQRLYLSHRTVGYHLHRIFPKLGVASRHQLHRAMRQLDGGRPGGP